MSESALCYQCPGEAHPIGRAVHLGRLASFYPACRVCRHRDDTGPLSNQCVAQLVASRRHAPSGQAFFDEGMAGDHYHDLDAAAVRRAASSLGIYLAQFDQKKTAAGSDAISVAIASDGRPLAAELIAAAADGLRLAQCDVVDLGSASAPALTLAAAQLAADGALLVGNAPGGESSVGLKFWGRAGRPLSRGAGLDRLQSIYAAGADRPGRTYGALRRHAIDVVYRGQLAPRFHALRPLRVAWHCLCRPMARQLAELAQSVACRFLTPDDDPTKLRHADLHVRIDGDGEILRVSDDREQVVAGGQLLVLLARHLVAESGNATVVLEAAAPESIEQLLAAIPCRVVRSGASRAEMDRAMRKHSAIVGGGFSGRFWFAHATPRADALEALAVLLTSLSQSDRRLSEVVSRTIFDARS